MSGRPSVRSPNPARRRAHGLPARPTFACLSLALLLPLSIGAQQPVASTGACEAASEAHGSVFGTVRETGGGFALPGSEVRLVWKVARGVVDTTRGELRTRADARGRYRFCDVPAGAHLSLWASALGKVGKPATLYLVEGEERNRDLELGLAVTTKGAVAGFLLDSETGEPLRTARLRLGKLDAVSGSRGSFRFQDVPVGIHDLTMHHIGYGTRTVELEVLPNQTRHVRISLAPAPIELQPITVTVDTRPVWLERAGFYERQAKGLGQFMGPEWMERRSPYRFSQVLQNVHGLEVRPFQCNPHCEYFVQTTTSSGFCPPTFYVDGRKLRLGSIVDLDALVPASDLAAVEVYRGISQTPAQYYGKCGAVVIWTKRG